MNDKDKRLPEDVKREVRLIEHKADDLMESCQTEEAMQLYRRASQTLSSYAMLDESKKAKTSEEVSIRAWWMELNDKLRKAAVPDRH